MEPRSSSPIQETVKKDTKASSRFRRHTGGLGVGALHDARMENFFDEMVRVGVTKPNVDYRRAYSTQFVNKGVGLDLRPKP